MGRPWYKSLWAYRKTLIIVLTPLVFLPLPILYSSKAGRCAYSIAILATFWMTEALPIAATALLPIFLFPWLGVLGSKPLCKNYLMDTNFLFFSGLLIAVAVEKWNLHKRIALKVLTMVGCQPRWLLMGFMGTTAFLSMWLSNTATAAMLMPIAFATLNEMHRNRKQSCAEDEDGIMGQCELPLEGHKLHSLENGHLGDHTIPINDDSPIDEKKTNSLDISVVKRRHRHSSLSDKMEQEFYWLSAGMKIGIAVAANIGGTATLTGTGPNIVLKGQVDKIYGSKTGLNFSSWFIFAFPNMVLCLIFSWVWMSVYFLGFRRTFTLRRKNTPREEAAYMIIKNEYKKLGSISFAEVSVAVMFTILAVLWFTREPGFMPGWGDLPIFEEGYITDACTGMTVAVLLFLLPSEKPKFLCFKSDISEDYPRPVPALLDWETVHSKMAWSVVVVLGGTFALADACKQSGLSEDVGRMFQDFSFLDPWVLVLVLCLVTGILTNITSNTATATILLPVVGSLAASIGLHPFYLMLPVAVTASLAFMLPVGTPPNAIVFAYGQTKIVEMFKSGIVINIVTILILQLSINTYGFKLFNLGTFPDWAVNGLASAANETLTSSSVVNTTVASLNTTADDFLTYSNL